ncbi:hypothetical protein F4678DRAFT_441993 [Xylaria arbuscula]|nr:hypothetical protein F4678DRAFT_441993 [Xylaria arbuscula]
MATMAVPQQQTPVPTIAGRADSCFKAFQRCLDAAAAIHPRELSLVEDQLARFSLWSSNIRVFVAGRGSLDYRLREAPDVQDAVVGVLEALDHRVQDCLCHINSLGSERTDNFLPAVDENLDRAIQKIANEISILHKFSNTIRRASKETHNYKAAKAFTIEDDEGNNVEPFLLELFSNNIHDRFPGASDNIRQRLADAMLMRRKRILYRRARYGNSIIRPREVPAKPILTQPQARPELPLPEEPVKRIVVTNRHRITAQSVAKTATTLSPENFHRASSPSVVSVSKTVALKSHEEIRFPPAPCGGLKRKYNKLKQEREKEYESDLELLPRPIESNNSQGPSLFSELIQAKQAKYQKTLADDWAECLRSTPEIPCPYCFCALPVEDVIDEKKWSLHVISDLDPYVCMFQECDSPEELYSHSNTWLKHMGEHARRWRCTSKSHGEFICSTRDEYLGHMKAAHVGKYTDAQLEVLADRNGRIFGPMFRSCPLCGIEDADGSIEHYLVGHMRFLAIKSLPSYEEDTEGLYEADSQDDSLTTSRLGTRSTINNDPDKHFAYSPESAEPDDPLQLGERLQEWSFLPNARGSSLLPNDPVAQAFKPKPFYTREKRRKQMIRMDPDCAICHAPATNACDCEAKNLEKAVQQAEHKMLEPACDEARKWVRAHAQDYVQEYFRLNVDRLKTIIQEEQVPQSPQELDQSNRSMKQGLDKHWQEAFQRYPEVLEYHFGLVEYSFPAEEEECVRYPKPGLMR